MRTTTIRRYLLVAVMMSTIGVAAQAASIHVAVSGFRNSQGTLACALFAGPEGFPNDFQAHGVAKIRVPIGATTGECVFPDVPEGQYAVVVFHDENGNGKLDKFLGIPLEGYGVSNNRTYATHGPRYDESEFRHDGLQNLSLNVSLRY